MIIERVNRFFGYAAVGRLVFRQGRPAPAPERPARPTPTAVPKELGPGLREIADPELRACLESLAGKIAGTGGGPLLDSGEVTHLPVIRSK